MKIKLWIIVVVFMILSISCERITRPRLTESAEIELKALAGLVTEAYLRIDIKQIPSNSRIKVYRNGVVWLEGGYQELDSVLHDEGLMPGSNVVYRAEVEKAGEIIGQSNTVNIQLNPTTTHEVTWHIYEFESIGGSGSLVDVAIVNKNDIWAVGKLHSYRNLVNALHWDGSGWEEKKISVIYRNSNIVTELYSVLWWYGSKLIFSAGLPYLPGNEGWKLYHLWELGVLDDNDGSVNNISKIDESQLLFFGDLGTIVKYQNGKWKKFNKVTFLRVQDIHVSFNLNFSPEILALASDFYRQPGSWLIKIEGEEASIIADSTEIPRGMAGLWFSSGKEYWLVGDGVLRSRLTPHNWQALRGFPRYFSHAIAATDINDVWIVGAYGLVSHYNGQS